MTINSFEERAVLDARLADDVVRALQVAIAERGHASLALSGGSTPKGFLQALSTRPLDWSRLTVTLVDDRWVPPDHPDSNDRLVRENLLQGDAAAAAFIPLVTDDRHPSDAVAEVSARVAGLGTVDVLILGMGGDGHFASLFPDSDTLGDGLDLTRGETLIAVDPPVAPHARMSMTLSRIFDTRWLILHIVGDDKRELMERARMDNDPDVFPIAAVLSATDPAPEVYWAP